jgi:quercetin dioxygenase-like cupin family protein
MELTRIDDTRQQPATAEIFDGDVSVADVLGDAGATSIGGFLVTFRDGGRTVWHTHEADQILLITDGEGVVEDERLRRTVNEGDIVVIPGGDRHWHGSEPGGEMTHMSFMTPGETTLG